MILAGENHSSYTEDIFYPVVASGQVFSSHTSRDASSPPGLPEPTRRWRCGLVMGFYRSMKTSLPYAAGRWNQVPVGFHAAYSSVL